ncbi:hypothetical protein ACNEP5_27515 [Escherichia coli]
MKQTRNLSEKAEVIHNRLGIALQIEMCPLFSGNLPLTDMNHIPSGVRHFTARQLGIRGYHRSCRIRSEENTRRESMQR